MSCACHQHCVHPDIAAKSLKYGQHPHHVEDFKRMAEDRVWWVGQVSDSGPSAPGYRPTRNKVDHSPFVVQNIPHAALDCRHVEPSHRARHDASARSGVAAARPP
eukprot:3555994-Rhodomonas_salina.1